LKQETTLDNTYETDELVSQYLEFHYGDEYFGVKNFPKACVDTIFKQAKEKTFNRALDLGCAVGRSSFELAKKIQQIDAIDFSQNFINNAQHLAENGMIRYSITDEGALSISKNVSLDDLGLINTAKRIHFTQGDACDLNTNLDQYDLIFAGNLIDRLNNPKDFLSSINKRINMGGLLVLTSPYTWLEEFTPVKNWVGGYQAEGKSKTSLEGLSDILKDNFDQYAKPIDIPFVIRETSRKYQHTIAQMTFWERK